VFFIFFSHFGAQNGLASKFQKGAIEAKQQQKNSFRIKKNKLYDELKSVEKVPKSHLKIFSDKTSDRQY
jgi:hypothetical protein